MRISICTLVSLINVLHNSLIFGKFPTGRFFFLLIYEFTASISLLLAEFVLVLMITGQFDHWEWLRSVLKKSKFSKLPKIGQNIPPARLFERLEYASPNPNDDIYKVKSTFSYVLTCFPIIWQSKEPKKLMLLCILILWPLLVVPGIIGYLLLCNACTLKQILWLIKTCFQQICTGWISMYYLRTNLFLAARRSPWQL